MAVYTITHNGETQVTSDLPATTTAAMIKEKCVQRWPELANAEMNIDANNRVTFRLPPGTKN